MADIRVGLIGVGPMASLHAEAIQQVPGLSVGCCVSRSPDRAAAFAERHGIGAWTTLDQIGSGTDVDALWLVAPADAMASAAQELSSLGLPMFLEKPVGLSLEETQAAVRKVAAPNMVGLNRRFYEVIQTGLAICAEAGGVRAVEVHMPEDLTGAAATHTDRVKAHWQFANSVHLIDLFRLFAGEPAAVQTANLRNNDVDRAYAGLIRFERGATGIYNAQWFAPGGWRVTVYADGVTLVYQPIEQLTVIRRPRATEVITPSGPDSRLKPGLWAQAQAFRDFVRTGVLPPHASDLADYERSVRLVDSLTRT